MTILIIDNYDSFTHNLAQQVRTLGADVIVRLNDRISASEALALAPTHLILSPGPGTPDQTGNARPILAALSPTTPTLGVCLGHQLIAESLGGRTIRAPMVMHGKTSPIDHCGRGLFWGVPNPMVVARYHSLVTEPSTLPNELTVTATVDSVVMAFSHKTRPLHGVQFHPESFLTPDGARIMDNFLKLTT